MKENRLEYFGHVKDGKITLPKRLRGEVCQAFEGRNIQVVFTRKRKARSSLQNAYYWAVVVPMILEEFINLGHDLQAGNAEHIEAVHGFLKARFLTGKTICDANQVEINLPPTTRDLSTVDFMDYLDNVCRWAAESLNLTIPEPNEQTSLF